MCQKRAKTAGLSENQPKKLFLQNSPTEMGKIQEMYCHICQDIISSLPQTALSQVEILLSNGVMSVVDFYTRTTAVLTPVLLGTIPYAKLITLLQCINHPKSYSALSEVTRDHDISNFAYMCNLQR